MILPTRDLPPGDLEAVFNATRYAGLGLYDGTQRIELAAGGRKLAEWIFSAGAQPTTRFVVPHDARGSDGNVLVTVIVNDPVQPSALGLSPDRRELGFFLCSFRIRPIAERGNPLPPSDCF